MVSGSLVNRNARNINNLGNTFLDGENRIVSLVEEGTLGRWVRENEQNERFFFSFYLPWSLRRIEPYLW